MLLFIFREYDIKLIKISIGRYGNKDTLKSADFRVSLLLREATTGYAGERERALAMKMYFFLKPKPEANAG